LVTHPRFRAAYDFLVLRAEAGEADTALADWWTHFQDADETGKKAMMREADRTGGKAKPRRRRHRSRKAVA
jgi:poly(A) polymerase